MFAIAASVGLLAVLMLDGGVVMAQTDGMPEEGAPGPVVVWEREIPEDWPLGQASHIIVTLEAYSDDGAVLAFALKESEDAGKFSLIPAGVNDAGNHVAHLVLREGEALDYEMQDVYLIGMAVMAESGATSELLLRLRIADVDEGEASPTPVATPTDPCFEVIRGTVNVVRRWDVSCPSENRPNDAGAGDYYARFFTFTLGEPATVSIRLASDVDTYVYLMRGMETDGEVVAENDDAVRYVDLNSAIESQELEAGEYTIEATAYDRKKEGSFRLVVIGLPDAGAPEADCSTGGAVSDAGENAGLVADCEALLGLRDEMAGSALLNWAADTPIADWEGVSIGGSPLLVTELSLDDSGLNGRVPSGLGMLKGLEILSLSGNKLRGSLPGELGSLANLKVLSMGGNQMAGEIPTELASLTNLETLELNDNRFGRDIPVELGSLAKLEILALSGNRLTGVISAELGRLRSLKTLKLANNRLGGEIPDELVDLVDLEVLRLAGNMLDGCIPPALLNVLDNDIALTGLDACASGICAMGRAVEEPDENVGLVSDCNALLAARDDLAGRVRLDWSTDMPIEDWEGVTVGGSPSRVIHLVLNQRGLSGGLPAELGKLSYLTLLHLSGNELSGAIPAELGGLSRLQLLVLADNALNGPIPPEFDGLASLSHMSLTGNQLSGDIPPELSSLRNLSSLYLDGNRLNGGVPEEFGSLPNLRFLYLDDNELSGRIPPRLGASRTLEVLSIDGNRLTGPIPAELGAIPTLKVLSLESNLLGGVIPAELGSLTRLEVLALAANRLTGEIPAQLGAIPNLETLSLHSNGFTGCIPIELRDVPRNDLTSLGLQYCGQGQCTGGTVVANPNDNHGLVSDCNSLLWGLDKLGGSAMLNWSTELPVQNWEGVTVGGSPRRVTEVTLEDSGLDGELPTEVANLTKLRTLKLSGNRLTGEIPPVLARLSELETLLLSDNLLSGQIPHDLTRINSLTELKLSGNLLTGCIPDGLLEIEKDDLNTLLHLPLCGEVDCASGIAVADPDNNQGLVSDCETLLELRDVLAGAAFLNWSVHTSIEEWDGITVAVSSGRVTRIELADGGLSGEIPPGIGDLDGLEVLALSDNELAGRIPSELGRLSGLKKLLLDGNELRGAISPELAVLNSLVELKLSGNNLSGCVPMVFRGVADNDVDELGLEICDAGECDAGTAVENPESKPGLVADCNALLAARDLLRGGGVLNWSADVAIEEWFGVAVEGSPRRVTQLKIGSWRLDGEIPPVLGGLSKLTVLSLADNRLSGEIPPELGSLYNLKELSLSKNRLGGGLPSQIGDLTSLERLSLSTNRLSGQIPTEIGNLRRLEHLSLSDNNLSGSIPPELGNLTALRTLYLSGNRLTGEIPSEIGDLRDLSYLRLSDNSLSGAIPPTMGSLRDLSHLYLSRNNLSGPIPPELGAAASLRNLHLSDNEISGEIPEEFGNLTNLTELYLSRNALTGPIPAELGDLAKLVQLYLSRNQLTGEIPAELSSLETLTHLFLGGNQLSGCIPAGLKDVRNNDVSLLNLPDCEVDN